MTKLNIQMVKTWYPTNHLRWIEERVGKRKTILLQQLWHSNDDEEWRNIPVIKKEEDGKENTKHKGGNR